MHRLVLQAIYPIYMKDDRVFLPGAHLSENRIKSHTASVAAPLNQPGQTR